MEVLGIYDSHSDLRFRNRNIFKAMDKFLSKYPVEYGECYRRNKESLELFKIDEFVDDITTAKYYEGENKILFSRSSTLPHELFHVASYDRQKGLAAFESTLDIEGALIEGMTEYLMMKAYGLNRPESYPFEVFTTAMLDNINDLFKHYFIPNHSEFVKTFPNKKDIYSLMYSLNIYHVMVLDYLTAVYMGNDTLIDVKSVRNAINSTINNLITIELSYEKDPVKLREYADKFMDLIGSYWIYEMLCLLYPNYNDYANKEINRRIRSKR